MGYTCFKIRDLFIMWGITIIIDRFNYRITMGHISSSEALYSLDTFTITYHITFDYIMLDWKIIVITEVVFIAAIVMYLI